MPVSAMTAEAARLRSVVRELVPDRQVPPAARQGEIGRLVDATAPNVVPQELLDLLKVMDGEPGSPETLVGAAPLLSCDGVIWETQYRSDPSELPWCPAWVVITSAGWHFDAVLAQPDSAEHSMVLNLSYGNQDYPVIASSMTSLVAASADLWERGLGGAIDYTKPGWQEDGKARHSAIRAAGRHADVRYHGSGEWRVGDGITPHSHGWPLSWPHPAHRDDLGELSVERLADFTPGMEHLARVTIADRFERYALVRDGSATVWSELAPGHEIGRSLRPGSGAALSFQHVAETEPGFSRADERLGKLRKLLRVTGVFSQGD